MISVIVDGGQGHTIDALEISREALCPDGAMVHKLTLKYEDMCRTSPAA